MMATLVGFVVARNPVIRRIVVPTNDRELDDPKMVDPEERMLKVSVSKYDTMTPEAMSILEDKLKALLSAGYDALDATVFNAAVDLAVTEAAALVVVP